MEHAWTRKKRAMAWFGIILSMVLSAGIILISIFIYCTDYPIFIGASIVLMIITLYVIKGIGILYRSYMFYYGISNNGIAVQYTNKFMLMHSWDDVSEISVCDVHHATRGDAFDFVIRIVIGEEPDGPRNKNCRKNLYGYEKWREDTYESKYWKNLVVIEYTPERYLKIREASGMEIKDYRRPYSDAWKIKVPN